MAKIYVGTSGWVYSDWQGLFYPDDLPQKKWLEFYGKNFKTVEVNATFYHSMRESTFENWSGSTPDDFVFAVKASRFITHIKRLKIVRSSIVQTIEPMLVMGDKLGPILFQLPPRFKADEKRLEAFLVHSSPRFAKASPGEQLTVNGKKNKKSVNRQPSTACRLAFEFRDPSWFNQSIYKILKSIMRLW